jgi:hypothetical protein
MHDIGCRLAILGGENMGQIHWIASEKERLCLVNRQSVEPNVLVPIDR